MVWDGIERRHGNNRQGEDGISLKEFILMKMDAVETATKISREGMNHRLESMNEFRDTLKDQAKDFVTRNELESILDKKASNVSGLIATFISIVGLVLAAISLIVKK